MSLKNKSNKTKNSKSKLKVKPNNIYIKNVQEPWFSLIQNKVKIYEGRPCKGDFAKMKKGDIVIWTNDITGKTRKVKTEIVEILKYDTFHKMISSNGLNKVLPASGAGIKTVDDGVNKVYRQWYNSDIEKQFGVIAIKLRVLK